LRREGRGPRPRIAILYVQRCSGPAVIGSGLRLRRSRWSHGGERLAPIQLQAGVPTAAPACAVSAGQVQTPREVLRLPLRVRSLRSAFAFRRESSRLGRIAPPAPKTGPVPSVRLGRLEGGGWTGEPLKNLTSQRLDGSTPRLSSRTPSLRRLERLSSSALRRGRKANHSAGGQPGLQRDTMRAFPTAHRLGQKL